MYDISSLISYSHGRLDHINPVQFSCKSAFFEEMSSIKKQYVWNILRNFEGMPITLPQTEMIIDGFAVEGVTINDLLKVKSYSNAYDVLYQSIESDIFVPDRYMLCELHGYVGRHELGTDSLSHFRREEVALSGIRWKPLHSSVLPKVWPAIQKMIDNIMYHPYERAIAVFLALSRAQFFSDCNKRTGLLFVNGMLGNNNHPLCIIPSELRSDFVNLLRRFYETGKGDDIMLFMGNNCIAEPDIEEDNEPRP